MGESCAYVNHPIAPIGVGLEPEAARSPKPLLRIGKSLPCSQVVGEPAVYLGSGERLRAWREGQYLALRTAANGAGVHAHVWRRIEQGCGCTAFTALRIITFAQAIGGEPIVELRDLIGPDA